MTTALTISQDYHAQLLAHESATSQSLECAHAHMLASIAPHLTRLYHQMHVQQATDGHKRYPLSWQSQKRLDALLAAIHHHVILFASSAASSLVPLLHTAAQLGSQNANEQVQALSRKPAQSPPQADLTRRILAATQQAQAKLATFADQATKAVKTALVVGLALGMTLAAIAKRVAKVLDGPRWWSVSITVTMSWSCYRTVQQDVFAANDLQEWEWRIHPGACFWCTAHDGKRYPVGTPMDTHDRCRCDQIAV